MASEQHQQHVADNSSEEDDGDKPIRGSSCAGVVPSPTRGSISASTSDNCMPSYNDNKEDNEEAVDTTSVSFRSLRIVTTPPPATTTPTTPSLSSSLPAAAQTRSPTAAGTHPITPRRLLSPPRSSSARARTDSGDAIKTVYLIRHGESLGQLARDRQTRKTDPSLIDCGLSPRGQQQALTGLRQCLRKIDSGEEIQLILTSPLSRAVHTSLLAFGIDSLTTTTTTDPDTAAVHDNEKKALDKELTAFDEEKKVFTVNTNSEQVRHVSTPSRPNIMVHYDLREIGDATMPENTPRKMKDVIEDFCHEYGDTEVVCGDGDDDEVEGNGNDGRSHIIAESGHTADTTKTPTRRTRRMKPSVELMEEIRLMLDRTTLAPKDQPWPRRHGSTPKVVRRDRIRQVFVWLYNQRPETVIAVVCHYHVIRSALMDPNDTSNWSSVRRLNPQNCDPIKCVLTGDGKLHVVEAKD